MHGAELQRAARALKSTRNDLDGRAVGAEEDGSKVVAHIVRAIAAVEPVALPELAVAVVAPALDAAVVEERAGAAGQVDRGGASEERGGAPDEPPRDERATRRALCSGCMGLSRSALRAH